MNISAQDIQEFRGYLKNCTNNQVQGCYDREKHAGRGAFVELCKAEAENRGIELEWNSYKDYRPGR